MILAQNAGEALKVLEKDDINVIFLDLKLFGVNGIELCRQIKALKLLSVIYAITGWAALFEIKECRNAGFDDYDYIKFRLKSLKTDLKKLTAFSSGLAFRH